MASFFRELKQRRVYRAALAYGVAGWLIIQIAATILPTFNGPNWAVRFVIGLVALGFPFALVVAWLFDLTPSGLEKTPGGVRTGRVWLVGGLGIIVAVTVFAGCWLYLFVRFQPNESSASDATSKQSLLVAAKSIAVLPFENRSEAKENEYFADGVQDEILTDLSRVADLKVISRTSVMQYRTQARNLREIGQQLGVAHILEGSVQCVSNHVRVAVQLVDARDDSNVWATHYDRDVADVFTIQSEIAEKIVDELRAKLSPNEKAAIERPPTTDLLAFDLYTRAKNLLSRTSLSTRGRDNLLQAVDLLDGAIARDPRFVLAYCQLASAHDQLYFLGLDHTPARLSLGDAAVETALRLQPDSSDAHLAKAHHLYQGYLDYDRARDELEFVRMTLPNNPLVFELAGYIDRRQGLWEGSTANLERALELDPRNVVTLQQIALSYNLLRRYGEMAAVLDRALTILPDDIDIQITRAQIDLDWRADTKPLRATIDRIVAAKPSSARELADAWLLLALCENDSTAAKRALAELTDESLGLDAVQLSREFGEALAARARGDETAARSAFEAARAKQMEAMRGEKDYGPNLCVLGLIDAGLGRKEDALREGRHAIELLPLAKDRVNGAHMIEFFGVICAWVGEKELACQQIEIAMKLPGTLSYGQLKLHPFWAPLRGDPYFEKIVATLAPDAVSPR